MPEETGHLRQIDAGLFAVIIEEAKLNARGDLGEDGKVRPRSVVGRAKRVRRPRPDVHRRFTTFLPDHAPCHRQGVCHGDRESGVGCRVSEFP